MNAERSSVEVAETWSLRLYIAGQTPKSIAAFANLKRFCAELDFPCQIEVIDLKREPHRAGDDQIVALPTLIRRSPSPVRRVIGDLSDTHRMRLGLDLPPRPTTDNRSPPGASLHPRDAPAEYD